MKKGPAGLCKVCNKPCVWWERNTDGTFLHTTCAMREGYWPSLVAKEKTHE